MKLLQFTTHFAEVEPVTIAELILVLQEFPADTKVQVADWNEQYFFPCPLTVMSYSSDVGVLVLQQEGD